MTGRKGKGGGKPKPKNKKQSESKKTARKLGATQGNLPKTRGVTPGHRIKLLSISNVGQATFSDGRVLRIAPDHISLVAKWGERVEVLITEDSQQIWRFKITNMRTGDYVNAVPSEV